MDRFGFEPSVDRSAAVDLSMRQALADSVAHVIKTAERFGLADGGDLVDWRRHLLETPAAPPALWACYHDLMGAIVREDANAVPRLAAELMGNLPAPRGRPGAVVTINAADLGATNAERYRKVIDGDRARPLHLVPALENETRRIAALLEEARAVLAETAPALLDEVDTLGHQVVLAKGKGAGGGAFGGAASIFLWGAVVLNPARVPDRVTMIESLAHETAHALLLGMTLGADLTTNVASERYASPLRPDLRPIEGIVHATYVLARMNYALERVRSSPRLEGKERALIEQKLSRNLASYAAGLETVAAHARFTAEGTLIFDACRAAIERRSAISSMC